MMSIPFDKIFCMGPVSMSTRPYFTGQIDGRNGKLEKEESVECLLTAHNPAKLPVKEDIKPPGQFNLKQGIAVYWYALQRSAMKRNVQCSLQITAVCKTVQDQFFTL